MKGITRERIVAAALELLNDEGMDALTVRALASRLGVRASALYWHLRNKQELLDEMSTVVMRRVTDAVSAIPPSESWRDDVAAYARVLRAEYLRHREGARIFSGRRVSDPEIVRAKESWLARLTAAGFTLAEADDVLDLITAFVVGIVIEEQERTQSSPGRYSLAERDAWLGEGAELVKAAGHLRDQGDARFERQLGIVLDGLDRAGPRSPSSPSEVTDTRTGTGTAAVDLPT
ncbi:TetR/AcrR family transcriptional regulator C-terminal domain-containing protein [Natronosporangium hydrolyticum]|uniref:TetR/AcrR family transcriptional regulator C-terminal domain-containing protein n=1 Tax=Natronosporangium hydrolyticum TaxID=2811111 RepID=A0A895Y558_9ACTN|nr:TetR/AcrR family transcriptional regulator C-terminal domain-containing protein [Natronosporangium hydrolyticum]QSB12827.1 TetR/AcrR family transcriptional regulator C-terminal domain-containing protein [Natronosporangium hydrolyticum]